MNCPHCNKVILVRLSKDDGKSNPEDRATSADTSDVGALLDSIHDDELETDFAVDFIRQTRERYEKYGAKTLMSEKQMNVLRKIAAGNPR